MSIAVLGAGAFGTALAIALATAGRDVTLIARTSDQQNTLMQDRENRARLPGAIFPAKLSIITLDSLIAETVLLATPMQTLAAVLTRHSARLSGRTLVACCKGIDLNTGLGPIETITTALPDAQSAILTGPSFATDIANGLPTALTLACRDVAHGTLLQSQLSTQTLRLYRTTDTRGAQLGGALKNIMAIACGAAIGAGLGSSARAAVMTRGFAEMQRFAITQGARPETLAGLSGFGDLALTCTSDQSRNYRYGHALGQGQSFDQSVTVEGAATARALRDIAQSVGLDMPITQTVAALVESKIDVAQAIPALLARPLKEE